MNSRPLNTMKQLCAKANEQLSKQNYEGMLEAEKMFSEIHELARKSPQKNAQRFAKSALYNVTEARKYYEAAESEYSHKFRLVCTWKNERMQLDDHLRRLYEDWKNLQQELEGPTIEVGEVKPHTQEDSLIKWMTSLRETTPQLYGGLDGTIDLMKDAKDMQDHCNGIKRTSYERSVREKRFSLAGKVARGLAAFGTLAVGAGFGFYRGIEGLLYAGMGETIGGTDVAELATLGVTSLSAYADAFLGRPYPRVSLAGRLGEAVLGVSATAVIGHTVGYVAGQGVRSFL